MDEFDENNALQLMQNDEFNMLKLLYGNRIEDLRKSVKLSKNGKKQKKDKLWPPLELTIKIDTLSEPTISLVLYVKCSRKYPLIPPIIDIRDPNGIDKASVVKLHKVLKKEAKNKDYIGHGCISPLIMRAELFLSEDPSILTIHPNKSFYDEMVERKEKCDHDAELIERKQYELDKLVEAQQVEEMKRKILAKKKLYHESRMRRESQTSYTDNDQASNYDLDFDLDIDTLSQHTSNDSEIDTSAYDQDNEDENEPSTMMKSIRRSRRSLSIDGRKASVIESAFDKGYSQSRVDIEYEVMEKIGSGGFGTVYKVKNRVDSRLYALKKVKLDADNESLNEKIMREVKLLSRLNHENVIRYYTAWTEIVTAVTEYKDRASSESDLTSTLETVRKHDLSDKLEDRSSILHGGDKDTAQLTSYFMNDKTTRTESSASYVLFEKDDYDLVDPINQTFCTEYESDSETDANSSVKLTKWLYIQMELGLGTLREVIDKGLPKDGERARRFFREILDGLYYIHRQGIVHRDLKPVNIFLDSMDRPKIGDFGLATVIYTSKTDSEIGSSSTDLLSENIDLDHNHTNPKTSDKSNGSFELADKNYTEKFGTPLYMSPELSSTNDKIRISRLIYSNKVDVYSLGIIYFEMLYPFQTGHERIIILQSLRKRAISMPDNVEDYLKREDIQLIRLLLTHNVEERPTSEVLLSSSLIPSFSFRERECQNVIKQVVGNRQARTHKHMIKLLFEQEDSYVDDFVFDFEDIHFQNSTSKDSSRLMNDLAMKTFILDQVKMKLEHLLRSRGYVNFVAPTLMPKYTALKYYEKQQMDDAVMLLDKNSSILTLPYDLRLPFARNIARTNINYINRFAIDRIYRQRQILGYHPDQLWECAVDIVSPPPAIGKHSSPADAEILNLLDQVVRTIPALSHLEPIVKLNHIQLVEQMMLMLGIKHSSIDKILGRITESLSSASKAGIQLLQTSSQATSVETDGSLPALTRENLKEDLIAAKLMSKDTARSLIRLLNIVGSSPSDIMTQVESFFNSRSLKTRDNLDRLRQILRDLEETIHYARGLGLSLEIRLSAGYVLGALRPIEFYSGMICLLECKRRTRVKSRSQRAQIVILAVGGRYDKLIEKFSLNRSDFLDREMGGDSNNIGHERENLIKVAAGVSFGVDRISRLVLEDHVDRMTNPDQPYTPTLNQLLQPPQHPSLASHIFGHSIRYWPLDLAIYSLTHPKSKPYTSIMSRLIRQLRDKGLFCLEIIPTELSLPLNSLALHCSENKIPFLMTMKALSSDLTLDNDFLQDSSQLPLQPDSPKSDKSQSIPTPNSTWPDVNSIVVTLYQIDSLRELKRCDISLMLDFLSKREKA